MIRVKIRYSSLKANGLLLRFDESISFDDLLRKVAAKLGIESSANADIKQQFQLTLDGDAVVEETSEIEHGDSLVLVKITDNNGRDETSEAVSKPAAVISQESAAIKKEESHDGDDDDTVEDTTEEMLKQKAAQKEEDTISLSSDAEGGDDDDDDDDDGSVQEGSDGWEEEEPSSEEDDSEDSDFEEETDEETTSRKRKRTAKPPPESPIRVIMDEKDVPVAPGKPANREDEPDVNGMEEVSTLMDGAGRQKADQKIKERVIKLLNTGFHDTSNENEAKNAMKLANRLMHKHNLSQAVLLKEREARNKHGGSTEEILKGGMVKVNIVNRKTGKPAQYARWIAQLTHPVSKNFGVKSYHSVSRGYKCQVVFYGIYTNAQLAGYAFRVATERIAQMTAEYTPVKRYSFHTSSTKSSKLSYALGIVKGISDEVNRNIKLEKERLQRNIEKARLSVSTGEAYEESDDEGGWNGNESDQNEGGSDNDGPSFSIPNPSPKGGEGDTGTSLAGKPAESDEMSDDPVAPGQPSNDPVAPGQKKSCSNVNINDRLQQLEQEEQAAIVLVDHGEKVAEEVLEERGIKLSSGRKRQAIQFCRNSYSKGVEDSKEIDISQRALRDETRVKKEEKS